MEKEWTTSDGSSLLQSFIAAHSAPTLLLLIPGLDVTTHNLGLWWFSLMSETDAEEGREKYS